MSWSIFLSLFLSEYISQCSAILSRVEVCVLIRVFLSLSLSFSLSQCLLIFSVIVRVYVRLFIFISVFSLNASIGFQLYCHWSFVYSVVPWFIFLSMFLSVKVNACITANITCICPSLYQCFSLSFCLWMCIPVSEYIFIHLILGVYVRLLIRVSVSPFLWLFVVVVGYIVTDCTYIGTSVILCFCLSLFSSVFLIVPVYYG